jgi:hypothetical protein
MTKQHFRHVRWGTAVVAVVLLGGGADSAVASDGEEHDASVAFASPVEGESVAGGVALEMTADGITIEEAGEVHSGAGHFHVIADAGCVSEGDSIVRDADHVHFGAGQAEGFIYLEPGAHELCLQVGDGVHTALDVTDRVTIDVGIDDLDEWCAVINEVDELFEAADTSDDEFFVSQVSYENIRRLLAQLDDGLDHVDAAARDDLATTIDFATELVTAWSTAADEATAIETVESFYSRFDESGDLPGSDWVAEHCDIDISD